MDRQSCRQTDRQTKFSNTENKPGLCRTWATACFRIFTCTAWNPEEQRAIQSCTDSSLVFLPQPKLCSKLTGYNTRPISLTKRITRVLQLDTGETSARTEQEQPCARRDAVCTRSHMSRVPGFQGSGMRPGAPADTTSSLTLTVQRCYSRSTTSCNY